MSLAVLGTTGTRVQKPAWCSSHCRCCVHTFCLPSWLLTPPPCYSWAMADLHRARDWDVRLQLGPGTLGRLAKRGGGVKRFPLEPQSPKGYFLV